MTLTLLSHDGRMHTFNVSKKWIRRTGNDAIENESHVNASVVANDSEPVQQSWHAT